MTKEEFTSESGRGHGHGHGQVHVVNRSRVLIALCLTGGFMVIEAIGGILSGSLALLARRRAHADRYGRAVPDVVRVRPQRKAPGPRTYLRLPPLFRFWPRSPTASACCSSSAG